MADARRCPTVGVIGSGTHADEQLCETLGVWIAESGWNLVTGGGGGVMASVAKGFTSVEERTGRSVGILKAGADPNPWVEVPVHTHLPHSGVRGTEVTSRNHIVVLTADVLVALPGAEGTASELALALEYHKPIVAVGAPDRGAAEGIDVVTDLADAQAFVRRELSVPS